MRKSVSVFLIYLLSFAAYAGCAAPGTYGRTAKQEEDCWNSAMEEQNRNSKRAYETLQKANATNAKNAEAVRLCYEKLAPESGSDETLEAVACLKKSPFASEAAVEKFTAKNGAVLTRLGAEVTAAVDDLTKQKQRRIYWFVTGSAGRGLYVPDSYDFGASVGNVYDLEAVGAQVISKSRIIGSDERAPLANLDWFSYQAKTDTLGIFTMKTKGGETYTDDSYQSAYPIKYFYGEDDKHWSALQRLSGTVYRDGSKAMIVKNQNLELAKKDLKGLTVKLLDEATAKSWIEGVSQLVAKQRQEIETAEAAKKANQDEGLVRVKNSTKGDEDSCEGKINNTYPFTDKTLVKCQLLNFELPVGVLKENGWLVTNVSNVPTGGYASESKVILAVKKAR